MLAEGNLSRGEKVVFIKAEKERTEFQFSGRISNILKITSTYHLLDLKRRELFCLLKVKKSISVVLN